MMPAQAEKELQGTTKSDKQEILFSRFGINYNEPEIFKKGSVMYREPIERGKRETAAVVKHFGLFNQVFWIERPWILGEDIQNV
jgi:tRNA(His) guanylyltransferase